MNAEEKQGLIEESKKEIERISAILATGSVATGWAKSYRKEILRHEIVVAALTTKPVKLPDVCGYEHPEKEAPFYTLNKDEVIAAIRDAGYEVQG